MSYCNQQVITFGIFLLAHSCNSGARKDEPGKRPAITTTSLPSDWDEDLNSGEFSGHECGPVHGKCPYDQCCSLRNECGNSTSHCNLSLGCKKKWGICH